MNVYNSIDFYWADNQREKWIQKEKVCVYGDCVCKDEKVVVTSSFHCSYVSPTWVWKKVFVEIAHSAGTIEYTDCTTAEG